MAAEWAWPVPPDKLILTTRKVNEGHPVRYAIHHSDGEWQLLDGGDVSEDDAVLIHIGHVVEEHPEIQSLADLPAGSQAWRDNEDTEWQRGPTWWENDQPSHVPNPG
jgi:hypothetical protein